MDIPQPPQDEELRNIIEKLAVFVARNGQEFEAMTKQKQQGNPRFTFLYGGEFYNYYMYRVTTEQAVIKHKAAVQLQRQNQGHGGMNIGQGGMNMNQGQGGMNMNQGPGGMNMNQGQGGMNMNQGPGGMNMNQSPGGMNMNQTPGGMNMNQGQGGMNMNQGQGGMNMPQQGSNYGPGQGQNFGGQQQNFGSSGPGGMPPQRQRFPTPGLFDQPQGLFDQPPGHSQTQQPRLQGRAHISRFDRGPGPLMQRFERPPMRMPFQNHPQQQQQQNFDNFGDGDNFDRGHQRPPGQGQGFEFAHQSQGPPHHSTNQPPPVLSLQQPQSSPDSGFDPRLSQFSQKFPQHSQQQQREHIVPQVSGPLPGPLSLPTKDLTPEIDSLKTQKQALEGQIKQSEQNLAGQNDVLMVQQQKQIDESIRIVQDAEIKQLAAELNVDIVELDTVLQPIVDSCTKDAISGGKAWIFTHTSTPRHYQLLSLYLLRKTTDPEASFNRRLHIIYLVNDVLHHCMRKGAEDLQQVLEAMVIPMFCHAKVQEMGKEENLVKLNKLLNLWESKNQYVSSVAVEKIRDCNNTWLEYHGELLKRHAVVVTQIAQNIQKTYDGYQSQHQIFCQHIMQNIKSIEQQIQQLMVQQQLQMAQQQQQQQQHHQLNLISPSLLGAPPGVPQLPTPVIGMPGVQPQGMPISTSYPNQTGPPQLGSGYIQQRPAGPAAGLDQPPNVPIPDISRPPPGFAQLISEKDLLPALPYYELPAGLMVPLVKPEDDNYKPMDPKAIRLPPPCPPSERLLQAVEAFYAPPSHERPRDSEGWERLGLYEYFKSKNLARKQKEDDIREGRRDKSKSPSPLRRDSSPSGRSPPRRRYQSKSPTPSRRRRSRSSSPSSRRKSRRRSRSRSRSPRRRSPTPPSFATAGLGQDRKLDESNKGHQLLRKMGWGGSGLGANEQGIEAPISGGEIRERKDLYKGVGISVNDPFESYRKSKGQAFVERMRQRAEDRP